MRWKVMTGGMEGWRDKGAEGRGQRGRGQRGTGTWEVFRIEQQNTFYFRWRPVSICRGFGGFSLQPAGTRHLGLRQWQGQLQGQCYNLTVKKVSQSFLLSSHNRRWKNVFTFKCLRAYEHIVTSCEYFSASFLATCLTPPARPSHFPTSWHGGGVILNSCSGRRDIERMAPISALSSSIFLYSGKRRFRLPNERSCRAISSRGSIHESFIIPSSHQLDPSMSVISAGCHAVCNRPLDVHVRHPLPDDVRREAHVPPLDLPRLHVISGNILHHSRRGECRTGDTRRLTEWKLSNEWMNERDLQIKRTDDGRSDE